MRILYVSSLWSGLRPLLFEGDEDTKGMPAFIEPLRYFVEHGHEVELILNTKGPQPPFQITAPWLKDIPIHFVPGETRRRRWQQRIALKQLVRERLAAFAPEFLYLHGTAAAPFWQLARDHGLPCGQRVYGTDNHLESFGHTPRWWIRLRKPGTWHAFNGQKDFVIATRDGSRGDLVQKKLNPHPDYDFHFLLNGFVPPERVAPPPLPEILDGDPYLFCPARFSRQKGKVRTVEFLKQLQEAGWEKVRLVVAGQLRHEEESEAFWQKVEEYGLQDKVENLGEIPREEVRRRCAQALAVLSLYRFSNLSNVTIETLSTGGLLVTLDDGSVEGIAADHDNAIVAANVEAAARELATLLGSEADYARLRKRAAERAHEEIRSWPERARLEESLIQSAVSKP